MHGFYFVPSKAARAGIIAGFVFAVSANFAISLKRIAICVLLVRAHTVIYNKIFPMGRDISPVRRACLRSVSWSGDTWESYIRVQTTGRKLYLKMQTYSKKPAYSSESHSRQERKYDV